MSTENQRSALDCGLRRYGVALPVGTGFGVSFILGSSRYCGRDAEKKAMVKRKSVVGGTKNEKKKCTEAPARIVSGGISFWFSFGRKHSGSAYASDGHRYLRSLTLGNITLTFTVRCPRLNHRFPSLETFFLFLSIRISVSSRWSLVVAAVVRWLVVGSIAQ